ncbi:MAG: hypothetical protein ABI347_00015 [Nitrososphaera sp.]|jgi:hypothetical protein
MEYVIINDPNDIHYPLSPQIFADPMTVYHGTSSVFAEKIEAEGWRMNCSPYDRQDIGVINSAFDSIGYTGKRGRGWQNLSFPTGTISFTQLYEKARSFATNKGGEAIKNMMFAIEDFVEFVDNPNVRIQYREKLQNKLNLEFLEKSGDESFLRSEKEKLLKIKEKLEPYTKGYLLFFV